MLFSFLFIFIYFLSRFINFINFYSLKNLKENKVFFISIFLSFFIALSFPNFWFLLFLKKSTIAVHLRMLSIAYILYSIMEDYNNRSTINNQPFFLANNSNLSLSSILKSVNFKEILLYFSMFFAFFIQNQSNLFKSISLFFLFGISGFVLAIFILFIIQKSTNNKIFTKRIFIIQKSILFALILLNIKTV